MTPLFAMASALAGKLAPQRHLDDAFDAGAVGELPDANGDVGGPVVDHVVGAGLAGACGLFRAADRRDHRRAAQFGELDRVATDRPGAAGDQHRPSGDRTVGEDAAVGGHGGDAETGAAGEVHVVGKPDGEAGRQGHVLGGRAAVALPKRLVHPNPLANP